MRALVTKMGENAARQIVTRDHWRVQKDAANDGINCIRLYLNILL